MTTIILWAMGIWAFVALIVYLVVHFLVPRNWIDRYPMTYSLAIGALLAPGVLSGGHAAIPFPAGAGLLAVFHVFAFGGDDVELLYINGATCVAVGMLVRLFIFWRQRRAAVRELE